MAIDLSVTPFKYFPKPMPGELAQSHFERIATFNMGDGFKKGIVRYRVAKIGKLDVWSRPDINELVAKACDMSEQEYFDRHSLNPIYRLSVRRPGNDFSERGLFIASQKDTSMYKNRLEVFHCSMCDEETKHNYGYRYLHRIHYVPGIETCVRHNVALWRICGPDILAWRSEGAQTRGDELPAQDIDAEYLPTMERYRELSVKVLESRSLVQHDALVSKMNVRLCSLGINWEKSHGLSRLGTLLQAKLSPSWLERNWPAVFCTQGPDYQPLKKRGFFTILLLSVICESVDEAMAWIFEHEREFEKKETKCFSPP